MVVPAIAGKFLTSAAGSISSQGGNIIGAGLAPLVGLVSTAIKNKILRSTAITLPPPDAIMQAYMRGYLSRAWKLVTGDQPSDIDIAKCYNWLMRGIGARFGEEIVGSPGNLYLSVGWEATYMLQRVLPGVPGVIDAWLSGYITKDQDFLDLLAQHGAYISDYYSVLPSLVNHLSPDEGRQLFLRGNWTNEQLNILLRRHKIIEPQDVDGFHRLTSLIPPLSDILTFLRKDVFNEQLARQLGYYDEIDENAEFFAWAKSHGMSDAEIYVDDRTAQMIKRGNPNIGDRLQLEGSRWKLKSNMALYYYLAGWRTPSPEQMYSMFHRLRPTRVNRYRVNGRVPAPVTATDINAVLKEADYPSKWRDRLTAIAYRPMGRVEIRQGVANRLVSENEATELYLDLGSDPETAKLQARLAVANANRTLTKTAFRLTREKILRGLQVGAISIERARELLIRAGLSASEADLVLATFEVEDRITYVTRFIGALRRSYLIGAVDRIGAEIQFGKVGIDRARQKWILDLWALELTPKRKELTAEKIAAAAKKQIIKSDEAMRRLTNLGYREEDAKIILRVASALAEPAPQ